MKPDQQDVFFNLIVSGGGEFIYDSGGNLREAGVGATTTDPVQGLTCPAGRSFWNGHGAILLLISDSNDAIFQYFDNGSAVQGGLVAALATAGGTDPVTGGTYIAGSNNINPVFGNFSVAVGSTIKLGAASFTQVGTIDVQQGSGAVSPAIVLWAPEQGQSGHLVMVMQGTSPDGTHLGQLLIGAVPTGFGVPTPQTSGMVEIQGRAGSPSDSIIELITQALGDNGLGFRVSGDTNRRLRINAGGLMAWGPGNAVQDTTLYRPSATLLAASPIAADVSGSAETEHAFSFAAAGYTQAAGRTACQYLLAVSPAAAAGKSAVLVMGSVVVPAGGFVGGQAVTNAAAAAYRPVHGQSLFGVDITSAAMVRLFWTAGGVLQTSQVLTGAVAVGDTIDIPPQFIYLND